MSASSLAPILGLPVSVLSYHLNGTLDRECGVVAVVRTRRVRGALETVYRVDVDALLKTLTWPSVPEPFSKGLKGAALVAFIEQAVAALESGSMEAREDSTAFWRPAPVDEAGWEEIRVAMEDASGRIEAAVQATAARGGEPTINAVVGLAVFEAAQFDGGEIGHASDAGSPG